MKIDIGTKVRTVALFVALLNQILVSFGYSPIPFDSAKIEITVTTVITGVAALCAWWKNSNITKEAQQAQVYLDELKANKKKNK